MYRILLLCLFMVFVFQADLPAPTAVEYAVDAKGNPLAISDDPAKTKTLTKKGNSFGGSEYMGLVVQEKKGLTGHSAPGEKEGIIVIGTKEGKNSKKHNMKSLAVKSKKRLKR